MNDFQRRWAVTMVRLVPLVLVALLVIAALIDATR